MVVDILATASERFDTEGFWFRFSSVSVSTEPEKQTWLASQLRTKIYFDRKDSPKVFSQNLIEDVQIVFADSILTLSWTSEPNLNCP